MKRLILATLILLCATGVLSAQTFVTAGTANSSASGATIQAPGIVVSTGDFIWGACIWVGTTQTVTAADGIGNTFTMVGSVFSANGNSVQLFYKYNITGGTSVAVCTLSASTSAFKAIAVVDYSGMTVSSPLDQTSTGSDASSTTSHCGSMTTTTSHELIVASSIVGNSVTTAGTGFTLRGDLLNFGGNGAEDQTVTSTGTYSPTFTQSPAGSGTCAAASFKATASSGPPSNQFPRVVGAS